MILEDWQDPNTTSIRSAGSTSKTKGSAEGPPRILGFSSGPVRPCRSSGDVSTLISVKTSLESPARPLSEIRALNLTNVPCIMY